jgi:hypothetical protein
MIILLLYAFGSIKHPWKILHLHSAKSDYALVNMHAL